MLRSVAAIMKLKNKRKTDWKSKPFFFIIVNCIYQAYFYVYMALQVSVAVLAVQGEAWHAVVV